MAAAIVEKKFALMHLVPLVVQFAEAAGGDHIVLSGYKGVIPLQGMGQSIAVSLMTPITWGTATITTTATTTTTSMAVTLATATRVPPYYVITAGGEIMEVTGETLPAAAGSTWTVRRGCLGTTASATGLAATNLVGIMNILITGTENIGPQTMVVLPLPNDSGLKIFE